jgi:hypothetical protein
MSLYRVASRRSRLLGLLVPLIALAVGLLVGFLLGRATAPEASIADALADPAADVAEARNALEVLTIEYPQAVSNGAVRAPTEYEAARADVRRARDALASADDLAALDPEGYRRASALLTEVAALVERKAGPAVVAARVRATDEALAELPGTRSGTG